MNSNNQVVSSPTTISTINKITEVISNKSFNNDEEDNIEDIRNIEIKNNTKRTHLLHDKDHRALPPSRSQIFGNYF